MSASALGALAMAVVAATPMLVAPATAEPLSIGGATITRTVAQADGVRDVYVRSTAMKAEMLVKVLPSRVDAASSPTLYLLNGAAGGYNGSSWFDQTDVIKFFADKNVNLVVPVGGVASYFTDWRRDDPKLGHLKWSTYLTKELPPLMDAAYKGSGRNAIAGISMAGTSVFQLSLDAPDLYQGIGAYSGCAMTSDPVGQAFVKLTVARGGGNTLNMWGPSNDPEWVRKDPYVNAEKLRGKAIYVAAGNGVPGQYDNINAPGIKGDVKALAERIAAGAVIESATNYCTQRMQTRLRSLGIPATFRLNYRGTHSWPYWQDDLHNSWPMFAAVLNQ